MRAWYKAEMLREMYQQDEVEQRKENIRDRKMMRGDKNLEREKMVQEEGERLRG